MSNAGFKPTESKREEFRKFLEKNGIMDALTKVLVNLYEEVNKPEDALEYIRDKLAYQAGLDTYNQLKAKLNETQSKITELEEELKQIKDGGASETAEEMLGEGQDLASALTEQETTGDIPENVEQNDDA